MSFDALAESCKSLLAMPTVRPNTGSSPAVSGTSADVDKPPSFQFVSVSPKIERKPLAVPLMFGPNISGSFTLQKAGEFNSAHGDILEGPFYKSSSKKGQFNNAAEWASEAPRVLFSASRSSSKYGNSTSVQPASIRLIHCIKS